MTATQATISAQPTKKPIRLLLCSSLFLLLCLMLGGCGERQERDASRVVLLAWHDWPEPQGVFIRELLKTFTSIHTNVTIVAEYVPAQEFDTKFLNRAQAGLSPDLVLGTELYLLNDLVQADLLLDLSAYDLNEADLLPHTVEALEVDGKRYGVPFAAHTNILYYNKKLLKKDGKKGAISPPKTLARIIHKSCAKGLESPF